MNKILINILQYFIKSNETITSRELSEEFAVSTRTIKTYIKSINEYSNDIPIIVSSNKGYMVNRDKAHQILYEVDIDRNNVPQNYTERIHAILKKLLIKNEEIDLFDLSLEMFVSYSTLKSDITKFNNLAQKNNLKLSIKNDKVQAIGDEKQIRKVISNVLFEEVPNKLMTEEILKKTFSNKDATLIFEILESLQNQSDIRVNEFSFMNLALHLLVLITFVKNGRIMNNDTIINLNQNRLISKYGVVISNSIESSFNVRLSKIDRQQINLLLQANVNYMPTNKMKIIENSIDSKIISAFEQIVVQIEKYYGVKLNSEHFSFNFLIHLNSLVSRVSIGSYIKNPMTETLKTNFPIVYDMAVFVSVILSEQLNIKIAEDEVAYISLHIGSEIENQKVNKEKIKTAIFCPNYISLSERMFIQISEEFEELNIVLVTFDLNELLDYDIELLITTIEISPKNLDNFTVVEIAPFLNSEQKLKISRTLDLIAHHKRGKVFVENFSRFFSPNLFYYTNEFKTSSDVLEFMCNDLYQKGIVNSCFYSNVLERENASPTAFDQIAIPHSIYMDSNETKISVLISDNGIQWDDKTVHIVFLTAINFLDREKFIEVYEGLISIYDNKNNLFRLKSQKSFKEFEIFLKTKIFSTVV